MADDKLKLLRQMREIVQKGQKIDSNHPHSTGISLLGQQKFTEAVIKFREAIARNPQFSFSHHYLGSALFETGNFEEAKKSFLQAAKLNLHYAATYLYLGKIEAEKENWREAEKYYRRTLELRPALSEAMFGLASVLTEIGEMEKDEAVELLKKIIQTDYTNDAVLAQLVNLHPIEAGFYLNLGDEFLTQGKTNKAFLLYRLAVLADTELPLPKLKSANILVNLGKSEVAAIYLHSAINSPNQNAESLHLAGDLFFRLASFDEAIAAYRQALKLKPDEAGIYKKIGDSLARQKQFEAAAAAYRQAIKLGYNY